MRKMIDEAEKEVKKAVYRLEKITQGDGMIINLMLNVPYEIELFEGVNFSCKVDLKLKRPPILLHCKFDGIPHHMNLYGSFISKEPNEKNK